MRMGRRVKEGAQAMKWVKQRAVTIHRRRAMELAQQEGDEVLQGVYAEVQTELYVPDPIVDVSSFVTAIHLLRLGNNWRRFIRGSYRRTTSGILIYTHPRCYQRAPPISLVSLISAFFRSWLIRRRQRRCESCEKARVQLCRSRHQF